MVREGFFSVPIYYTKENKHKMNYYKQTWRFTLFIALLLQSCSPAIKLYQSASTAFSSGAKKEMTGVFSSRFNNAPAGAVPTLNQALGARRSAEMSNLTPAALYQQSLDQLNRALKNPGPLRENDVLGNALTVKALAAWKLKQYGEAESAAKQASDLFRRQEETSPRDEVLSQSIPALITLDVVYDSTQHIINQLKSKTEVASSMEESEALALFKHYQSYYDSFIDNDDTSGSSLSKAFLVMESATASANQENKEVNQFVLLSQLTGLKNWYDGLFHLDNVMKLSGVKANNAAVKAWIGQKKDRYEDLRLERMEKLGTLLAEGEASPIFSFWDSIL